MHIINAQFRFQIIEMISSMNIHEIKRGFRSIRANDIETENFVVKIINDLSIVTSLKFFCKSKQKNIDNGQSFCSS